MQGIVGGVLGAIIGLVAGLVLHEGVLFVLGFIVGGALIGALGLWVVLDSL